MKGRKREREREKCEREETIDSQVKRRGNSNIVSVWRGVGRLDLRDQEVRQREEKKRKRKIGEETDNREKKNERERVWSKCLERGGERRERWTAQDLEKQD